MSDVPTRCSRCGQKLMLLAEGRDVCERCRLGRTPVDVPVKLRSFTKDLGEAVKCRGCGETEVEKHPGVRKPIAEGFCLDCRVQGLHLV